MRKTHEFLTQTFSAVSVTLRGLTQYELHGAES